MANEIIQSLTNNLDASLVAVSDALPKDFNKARFLQNAMSVVKSNPDLLKYNQTELLTCMLRGAYLSLDFYNKECWLVPYAGHVTFQTGYKGDCKFVKKYSIRPLSDVYAKPVRQGDVLDYGVRDGEPYLTWKPLPFNDGEIVGVFAVAFFKDGGMLYEVMSKAEVDKVRRVSKAGASNSSPWATWYESMACKTVLRKLCKGIETDFDNVEQREAWEEGGGVDFNIKPETEVHNPFASKEEETTNDDVIDTTAQEVESMSVEMPFGEVNNG